MTQLIGVAKKERTFTELEGQFSALQNLIGRNRSNDLMRYKDEITNVLEEEIAFHYGLIKFQVELSLVRDKQFNEAIKYLREEAQYKNLLSAR